MTEQNHNTREQDHDLLIRVDENVKNLIIEVKNMRDGTTVQLTDHELRIRRLETWGFTALGALFVIQMVLKFYFK